MSMMQKTDMVSIREKICYAAGDASANIAWRSVSAFLFIVYTDVFGLGPASVGTLMLVARLGDGISDVVIGAIADRTRTRWGSFRPWIFWSIIPLGVSLSALFTCPEHLGLAGRLVYAYVTYILFTLIYTAMNIPYGAMISVMTTDDAERTSIGSYRMVGAYLGGLVVQGALIVLKDHFNSYTTPIYILSVIMVVIMPLAFFGTRERVAPPVGQKNDLWADLRDLLLHNCPWVILLVTALLFNVVCAVKQGVTIVYFSHYMNKELLCAGYLTALMLAAAVGAGLTSPLARLIGKRNLFVASLVLCGFFTALIWFCHPGDVHAVFVLGVLGELFSGIFPTLCFVMLGDVADYSELRNGRRATGLTYSATSFAMKFGCGVAGLIIGYVLARYGYDGARPESFEGARTGMRLLMSLLPGGVAFLAAFIVFFYPITSARMLDITRALAERRGRDKSN